MAISQRPLLVSSALLLAVLSRGGLHAQDPPKPGVDQAALDHLVQRCRQTQSDALLVVKDDVTLGEWYFDHPDGPIEAMSATKSVVALGVGRLLADGRLASLDVPVCRYYPEWNQGRKAGITIRHLLTQRSGLQCERITTEIYRASDFVQLALAAELSEDPGKQFRYNNKAVNLLAGVIQKISGQRMDQLIGEEIFEPLGITDWSWSLDQSGNPHGMSGLQIRPADLVKIGQLMLRRGAWEGEQILPESFVSEAVHDHVADPLSEGWGWRPHYGLLWWVTDLPQYAITDRLLAEWHRTGAPDEFVAKMATLAPLRGEGVTTRAVELAGGQEKWNALTWQANRPDFDIVAWTNQGYSAEGYLGQYLVVVPEQRLIAVRMRRAPGEPVDEKIFDQMRDFKTLVLALVPKAR